MSSILLESIFYIFLFWNLQSYRVTMANCTSNVYCQGPLLDAVQRLHVFNDSKTFVDMPLKHSPEVVVQEFDKLAVKGNITKEVLTKFVEENFYPTGQELETVNLTDWTESPPFLSKIADVELRKWASDLNRLWNTLARKVKDDVAKRPTMYSLLYVPNPFVIPGDRFREFYYWDTYWIVKGLLVSNMTQTTKGILENFLHIYKKYNLIPNGGRVYYLNRSQPPLLTPMMYQYYLATKDIEFIRDSISILEQEYDFWVKNRSVEVKKDNATYTVNRYYVEVDKPRPEGYPLDLEVTKGLSPEETVKVLINIASACESGSDFTSRWFHFDAEDKPKNMTSIMTSEIAPVDLSVYLGLCERILAYFFGELGDETKRDQYDTALKKRVETLNTLFWNKTEGIWFDIDFETLEQRPHFQPTNVFPLLLLQNESEESLQKLDAVINYLKKEKVLDYPGGIPSSKFSTGQQWDFPNVWSPHVSFLIEALDRFNSSSGHQMALRVAENWIQANYDGWKKYGQMFEKYDADTPGAPGGGGEYTVQAGFGWTNGVILELAERYGQEIKL